MDAEIRRSLTEKGEAIIEAVIEGMYQEGSSEDFESSIRIALSQVYWQGARSMAQEMFEDLKHLQVH